jgi:hypothetical protein
LTPVFVQENSVDGVPDPNGERLDAAPTPGGDIQAGDGEAVITGPSGVLTLTRPGAQVLAMPAGDLDGDGRGDSWVTVYDSGGGAAVYLVPARAGAGAHDPSEVGVRLPIDRATYFVAAGDQNRDGAEDLFTTGGLYSGRALLAPGPGSRLDALPDPLLALDDETAVVSVVDLRRGAAPTALARPSQPRPDNVLRLLDDSGTCFAWPETSSAPIGCGQATAWLVNGHRIVQCTSASLGGTSYYRWDLDA